MTEENEEQARLEKLRRRSEAEDRFLGNPYRNRVTGLSSTEVILSMLNRGDDIKDPELKALWQAFEDLPADSEK